MQHKSGSALICQWRDNIMRNVSRFLSYAHMPCPVGWCDGNGYCATISDKCSCAAMQNEVHVLNHCQDLFVCTLTKNYSFNKEVPFSPFLPVLFFVEAPYILLPYLVRLSLIFFLNGTTNSAILFLTLWTIFLAGEDQQQTN